MEAYPEMSEQLRRLHSIRDQWCFAWTALSFTFGSTTNQRAESINRVVKNYGTRNPTLAELASKLKNLSIEQFGYNKSETRNAILKCSIERDHTRPVWLSPVVFERWCDALARIFNYSASEIDSKEAISISSIVDIESAHGK